MKKMLKPRRAALGALSLLLALSALLFGNTSVGEVNSAAHAAAAAPRPDLTRTITEWTIPGCVNIPVPDDPPFIIPGCEPLHPTVFSDRRIFFTERQADKIGELDTVKNVFTEWALPPLANPNPPPPVRPDLLARPHGIVKFRDGVMFCETGKGMIGFLDPTTNDLTEWQIPFLLFDPPGPPRPRLVSSNPLHPDPRGKLVYFTVSRTDRIAALDPELNQITQWPVPTVDPGVNGIAVDGNRVFFAEVFGNKIGMLDLRTNTITEWALTPDSFPQHLVKAGRYVFFIDSGGKVGRLDPNTNVITEWEIPTPASNPADIDVLSANLVIFTESNGNKIGQLETLEECGVSRTVLPVVTAAPPTQTDVPVSTTIVVPISTPALPVKTTVIGIQSCGFTEWPIPTPGSRPTGLRRFRGKGAVFCESQENKIGVLSWGDDDDTD
ncbi:MAG: hypothetical protein ABR556_05190 [Pyrinomonadaceae bacterium]